MRSFGSQLPANFSAALTDIMDTTIMAEMVRRMARVSELTAKLTADGIPLLAALVIAGDIESEDRADAAVRAGADPLKSSQMVGSYARFDWCVRNVPRAQLLSKLADLWVWSDPDDTKPEYLTIWREAFAINGKKPLTLGRSLPDRETFVVYRGQIGTAEGIAWTLDRTVAASFARTGGMRAMQSGGWIRRKVVQRSQILAYLTARNEQEVILDFS